MTQALHLMNAPKIHTKLISDQGLPARLAAKSISVSELLDELYLTIYSRLPTPEEQQLLTPLFEGDASGRKSVLEDLVWSLINSSEFVYED